MACGFGLSGPDEKRSLCCSRGKEVLGRVWLECVGAVMACISIMLHKENALTNGMAKFASHLFLA